MMVHMKVIHDYCCTNVKGIEVHFGLLATKKSELLTYSLSLCVEFAELKWNTENTTTGSYNHFQYTLEPDR